MGYAVCHRDASGTLQVDDVTSLDAAVEVVERLRNEDGTRDVRVFREIPIEVKTYYKISIVEDEPTAAPEVTTSPAPAAPFEAASAARASEPVPAVAATPAAPVAPVDPLPGAFPLAAPTPPPAVEVHDADLDTSTDVSRRHSLFGRGG